MHKLNSSVLTIIYMCFKEMNMIHSAQPLAICLTEDNWYYHENFHKFLQKTTFRNLNFP